MYNLNNQENNDVKLMRTVNVNYILTKMSNKYEGCNVKQQMIYDEFVDLYYKDILITNSFDLKNRKTRLSTNYQLTPYYMLKNSTELWFDRATVVNSYLKTGKHKNLANFIECDLNSLGINF